MSAETEALLAVRSELEGIRLALVLPLLREARKRSMTQADREVLVRRIREAERLLGVSV